MQVARRWGPAWLPLALALFSGCATISVKSETIVTRAGKDRVTRSAIPESRMFDVSASTRNRLLVVSVGQFEVCEVTHTPRVRRVQKDTKTVTGGLGPTVSLLLGAGLVGGGIYGLVAAESLGRSSGNTSPTTYQVGGAALAAAGLTFVVIGIVDLVRSRDSVEDLGVADGEPTVERVNCNESPLPAGTKVRLRTGTTVLEAASIEGKAVFSMTGLSLADLPLERTSGMIVGIDGATLPLVLSPEERASLKQQLGQDQSSKFWIESNALKQTTCDKLTTEARAVRLDPSASVETMDTALVRWKSAQDGCGDLWSKELAAASWGILSAGAKAESARFKGAFDTLLAKKGQLTRAISIQSGTDFESALDVADAAATRCKALVDRLPSIADSCSQLEGALESAREFRDKISDKLAAMREAREAALARQQDVLATKLWRAHFGKCQELIRAVRRLEQVSYRGQCDADCRAAAAKMQGESERLSEFEVSAEIGDEALTERLRLECQAAGCAVCP